MAAWSGNLASKRFCLRVAVCRICYAIMPPKRTRGGAPALSQQPFLRRNPVDEVEVIAQHSVFVDLPTSSLLAIVVGVSCRLQCAVSPLHAPDAADDRESRFILRDHCRVVASARVAVTRAVNFLIAAEAALLQRTAETALGH